MKEPEVYRREGRWLLRRWMVFLPDTSVMRTFTKWGANRKARKAKSGRHRKP
jgi:hypothetical protein